MHVFFERNVWKGSTEGLFITSCLVILLANFLPLDRIAILASASLLIIYIDVNASHRRLLKETRARLRIIRALLLSSPIFFGLPVVYYEFINSKLTLGLLALKVFSCFFIEWIYRRSSGRSIEERTI